MIAHRVAIARVPPLPRPQVIAFAVVRDEWDQIGVGRPVRLTGLRGLPISWYNGATGEVLRYDEAEARYAVRVTTARNRVMKEGLLKTLSVRRQNLVRLYGHSA